MSNKLNFVFFGGEPLAVPTLEKLYENGFMPMLIVASPDAKRGRGLLVQASPVAIFAEKHNIPCLKPEKLDAEFTLKLSTFNFQLFVVVAYGKIIPKEILDMSRHGAINIHPSLLPKYRGPSPIVSAILNGDQETGVTIIRIDEEMDHGPILAQEKLKLTGHEMIQDLEKTLGGLGSELLVKLLKTPIPDGVKQDDSQATYCKKIKKEDGLINLSDDTKENNLKNYKKFRAYANWPRTFFFTDNKRIIITEAKLENDKFIIEKIIPEGGKEINYKM